MFKFYSTNLGKNKTHALSRIRSLFISTNLVEEKGRLKIVSEKENYSIEELMAMIFEYIKQLTAAQVGTPINECVITIPPWYTQKERVILLDAGKIAKLRILGLITEQVGTSLEYGSSKIRGFKTPKTVMFYDIGANSVKVYITRFRPATGKDSDKLGTLKVRGVAWDQRLGGMDFDSVIANECIKEFKRLHGVDLTNMPREMSKLMVAATRAREVLSANSDTALTVESLHNDIDFKYIINRDKFEQLSKPLLERLTIPVKKVLEESKIKIVN
jgi:molecular chaperone DnaK (HSP70)